MIEIMTASDRDKFLERIWIVDFVKHEEDEGVIEKEIELLNGKKIKVCCFCLKYYDKFFKAINEIGFSQQFGELKFTTSKNVIELLIEPLYQQQEKLKVVTRELLQNALDACKMKGVSADIKIRISEAADSDNEKIFLEIEDNGIGMNPQELRENFLTVGKSNKNNSNQGLVGKYGIGILSIFLIGDYAEVYTKKSDNVLLPLKIYIDGNEKRVEWLEMDGNSDIGIDNESFTIVKIRLNNEMRVKLKARDMEEILNALGLERYITKPEYTISVQSKKDKGEIPKANKKEWFLEMSSNIKIYKKDSIKEDESELTENEKCLKKVLEGNELILYNDLISSAKYDISKYSQLNNIRIPFVMLDVTDADNKEIVTDLSRSSVQITGTIMDNIAKGIYTLEVEKIVGLLEEYKDKEEFNAADAYELLKKIRGNSAIVRNNIDIFLFGNKLVFYKAGSWKYINVWGSERAVRLIADKCDKPVLWYELFIAKSAVSDCIERERLICISAKYLERYICEATSSQNGLRKGALLKILHHLGFQEIQESDSITSIWQFVKENRQRIREAYRKLAPEGLLWFEEKYDIGEVDMNNDYFIICESYWVYKRLDNVFCDTLKTEIEQKSLNEIVSIQE